MIELHVTQPTVSFCREWLLFPSCSSDLPSPKESHAAQAETTLCALILQLHKLSPCHLILPQGSEILSQLCADRSSLFSKCGIWSLQQFAVTCLKSNPCTVWRLAAFRGNLPSSHRSQSQSMIPPYGVQRLAGRLQACKLGLASHPMNLMKGLKLKTTFNSCPTRRCIFLSSWQGLLAEICSIKAAESVRNVSSFLLQARIQQCRGCAAQAAELSDKLCKHYRKKLVFVALKASLPVGAADNKFLPPQSKGSCYYTLWAAACC